MVWTAGALNLSVLSVCAVADQDGRVQHIPAPIPKFLISSDGISVARATVISGFQVIESLRF